jgi:alkylated DNA repair protein alkB family protein 1
MVLPDFLDPTCQNLLLDRLLHRDLSNSTYKTNLSLHYDVTYPSPGKSFLDNSLQDMYFVAKDPTIHQNLTMERVLQRKLRWITLGGQYDWTQKAYPEGPPPEFPKDISTLLHGIFPDIDPQAAIVNFYSPGDTLSLHRDVSEQTDRGLVSISLGCEGIFLIGLANIKSDGTSQYHILRLRSGDAVYMSDKSRYAWHGVPRIIPNTCPKHLEDWPGNTHLEWQGYMKSKRINLNVRQMFAT